MKTKFEGTPGPWHVDDKYCDSVQDRTGQDIALSEVKDYQQCEANARLIATAPELLEALQEFVDLIERKDGMFSQAPTQREWFAVSDKAEAAIKKALEG